MLHGLDLTTLESLLHFILGFVLIVSKNVYLKEISTDKWDVQGCYKENNHGRVWAWTLVSIPWSQMSFWHLKFLRIMTSFRICWARDGKTRTIVTNKDCARSLDTREVTNIFATNFFPSIPQRTELICQKSWKWVLLIVLLYFNWMLHIKLRTCIFQGSGSEEANLSEDCSLWPLW